MIARAKCLAAPPATNKTEQPLRNTPEGLNLNSRGCKPTVTIQNNGRRAQMIARAKCLAAPPVSHKTEQTLRNTPEGLNLNSRGCKPTVTI